MGAMLNEGRPFMQSAPHLIIFPGLMIMLTVLAFNLVRGRICGREASFFETPPFDWQAPVTSPFPRLGKRFGIVEIDESGNTSPTNSMRILC